jgi:putative PEP-CTERM system histidine kinase
LAAGIDMISPGTLSYGLAAAAFLALSLLLLTRWRMQFHGSMLLPASLMSFVWSGLLAWQAARAVPTLSGLYFLFEITRNFLWLVVLLRVLSGLAPQQDFQWIRRVVYVTTGAVLIAALVFGVLYDLGYRFEIAAYVLIPGMLLSALAGLFLVEQVYRNTSASREWSVKFLWIGAGALFVYDFCLYSVALLFRAMPFAMWEARGAANALAVPLLAIGMARTTQWAPQVFMSRRPALYTTSIVAAGLYLLAMAIAGFYVRSFGGSWGGAAQIVFLFGAALLLVLILFSGQARAWLRVFLTKHFSPYRYDYRDEWLRLTRTLSTGDAGLEQNALTALARIVNSNAGGIWTLTEDGQFVPSGGDLAGPDSPPFPADSDFLSFIAAREWIVDLDSVRSRVSTGPEPSPPDWLLALERAWLVLPLLQDERLVAVVVISRSLTPRSLTWEDLDLLRTAGRQAASYIALEQAAVQLAQARQFEAYNRFAAFMMHDLKNLIAQQTLVVQNAARHRGNPQFIDDAISTIDNSVRRMQRLLEQLRRGDTLGSARRVQLAQVCSDTVNRCGDRRPTPVFEANGLASDDAEVLVSAERLGLVLEHIIRNAQDATDPEGRVEVQLRRNAGHAVIEVRDTGCGMDATFIRERLFRPFDTTKGSQGMGIGAFQTREFVRMAGGDVHVESDVGKGTRFFISIPLASTP